MAKNRPCWCPNCRGTTRAATTVKKHAAKTARIEAASIVMLERYKHARQDAYTSESYESDNEGSFLSEQDEGAADRPNKIRRTEAQDMETELNIYQNKTEEMGRLPSDNGEHYQQTLTQDLRAGTKALNYLGQVPIIPATPPKTESSDDDWQTLPAPSQIENVRLAQSYNELIKNATLDNGKMDPAATERLRNPSTEPVDLSNLDLRFSLDLYLAAMNSSEATYNQLRQATLRRFPDMDILSYHLAKKKLTEITGVVSVLDDMCINSCHAFTGPFEDLDACTICSEPRYTYISSGRSRKRVPRQQMTSYPIGPQIQALCRSLRNAEDASYRARKVAKILNDFEELLDPTEAVDDDIFCGEDLRNLSEQLNLTEDDTIVILSLGGVQLHQSKKSDTWIAIFTVTEYHPKTRYKAKHTLPAMATPGRNKSKIMDSCLYRTLHHLSAIQREDGGTGIKIYNAAKDAVVSSRTVLLFATSDAPGLVGVDDLIGHHGTHGSVVLTVSSEATPPIAPAALSQVKKAKANSAKSTL